MHLRQLLKWDFIFLGKYGILAMAIIVAAVWMGIISFFSPESMRYVIPMAFITDFAVSGFIFMGAMLFMDKDQDTITPQMVSPIKTRDYMLSKIIALTAVITFIAVALTIGVRIIHGVAIHLIGIVIVSVLASSFFILLGFIIATYFKSFTDMILPMGLLMTLLFIPFLIYVEMSLSQLVLAIIYIIPTYSMITIIEGLFISQPLWKSLVAIFYVCLWIVGLFKVGIRVFNRQIIGRKDDIDGLF